MGSSRQTRIRSSASLTRAQYMHQNGLFDVQMRVLEVNDCGNPLLKLGEHIDWDVFRPSLQTIYQKQRKSNAGRKPYDVVLMFKILVLQSLYNLSDHQMEFQIKDRLSFMQFLGLHMNDRVPDEKTVWAFREQLKQANLFDELFDQFNDVLNAAGYQAREGQILDASTSFKTRLQPIFRVQSPGNSHASEGFETTSSIVPVPIQRNTREENARIKDADVPPEWSETPEKTTAKGRRCAVDEEERPVALWL